MKIATAVAVLAFIAACTPQIAAPPPSSTLPPTVRPQALTVPTSDKTPTSTSSAVEPITTVPSLPFVLDRFQLRDLPGFGRSPVAMAMLGDKLYIVNSETANVSIVQKDRLVANIAVGGHPSAMAADLVQKRLFVANNDDKTLSVIVNDVVVRTIGIGESVGSLAFLDDHLFVGLETKGTIVILDSMSLQKWISIDIPRAWGVTTLSADPERHRLYATVYERVAVIDSANWKLLSTFDLKDSYYTLAVHPQGTFFYSSLYDSATKSSFLGAFDTSSGVEKSRVKIGEDPRTAVLSRDSSRLYVANSYSDNISVVDPRTMTSLGTIPVDIGPRALALDDANHRLYVGNQGSDNVSVIDTDKQANTGNIPLAIDPTALLADQSGQQVYVAVASTDSIYAIDRKGIAREIPVGHHPMDIARDAQSGRLMVANAADGSLSIIDESNWSVRTSEPITRGLSTVAIDSANSRLFAGSVILDLKTFAPVGKLLLHGNTVGSVIEPDWVRFNPRINRIYAVGWNGTPGSNSRSIGYSVDGASLQQRGVIGPNGNLSSLVIDPDTNRVFVAGTHPLAYTTELAIFDSNDKELASLPLSSRTTGMEYNPSTHHLFLSHATDSYRGYGPTPMPANDLLEILDGNSLGTVTRLTVKAPGKMARLGNLIFVASREDGSMTIVQDTPVPTPASPTPTLTPTPWPTDTPGAAPRSRIPTTTPITGSTPQACSFHTADIFSQRVSSSTLAQLGCAVGALANIHFAAQQFQHGLMIWHEDEKQVYVLVGDKSYINLADTWIAGMPDDSCPNIAVVVGTLKPIRGFGKVWCDSADVRNKLGAATAGEYGFSSSTQRFERGFAFINTEGIAISLLANGKWD